VEEVELSEVLDHGLLHRPLEGEIELLEGLSGGETGGADAALATVRLAGGHLGGQERLSELLKAPLLRPGALGELRERPRGGGGLELAEQVGEL
jgi:hypothetical protein